MKKNRNWLIMLTEANNIEIGTKAKNLKQIMENTNYLVPKTLVITTCFYKYLIDYNKINSPFLFNWRNFEIPPECEEEVIKKIEKIFGNKYLVIRSSATCEDSPILSFAGQYSTFLNIKGRRNILSAIKLCYGSLFSENAKAYAKFKNVMLEKEAMAILIQEVIPVKISGIIFTADPVTKDKDKMIIEYTQGFGDKIVSGEILPKYIEVSKSLASNKLPSFLETLMRTGLTLEEVFNYPQNIEWGFDGNKFYIFQSRPITSFQNSPLTVNVDTNKLILVGKGRCACLGQCEGKLKIIKNSSDYLTINRGDIILNKRKTDIRIINKILDVAGIITTGGILSHFAVIAREFNKPTLVEPLEFNGLNYRGKKIFLDGFQGKIFVFK